MNQLIESVVNFWKILMEKFSTSKHTEFQSSKYLINELAHGCAFFQDSHYGL